MKHIAREPRLTGHKSETCYDINGEGTDVASTIPHLNDARVSRSEM